MKVVANRGGVDSRALAEAIGSLNDGQLIIYPTDTGYALACDALNMRAIERLCRIKGLNPEKNNLSVVCADMSQAAEYARIDNRAFRILKECLPGAYTFILPASTTLPKVFKGRKCVGIRIPGCDFARALAAELDHPVLTTSVSAEEEDVWEAPDGEALALRYEGVPDIVAVVDAGPIAFNPGTVVDLTDSADPVLVREGAGEWPL